MSLIWYHSLRASSNFTAAVMAELDDGADAAIAKRVDISPDDGETRSAQYLSEVNPNGQVPAIVHDGVPIWEAAAITMYLGEVFGEKKGLYPSLGPTRGEAMKWIVWTNVNLAEAFEQQSRADVDKCMRILDGGLEKRDYLLQSGYSLADTHVWAFISWVEMLFGLKWDAFPNVKAWSARVGARPPLKRLW